jgi:stage V sporulation protein SpoVS
MVDISVMTKSRSRSRSPIDRRDKMGRTIRSSSRSRSASRSASPRSPRTPRDRRGGRGRSRSRSRSPRRRGDRDRSRRREGSRFGDRGGDRDRVSRHSDRESRRDGGSSSSNRRSRENDKDNTMWVGSNGKAPSVAGYIAHQIRKGIYPEVCAAEMATVNVMAKALSIARQYLKDDALDFQFTIRRDPDERDTLRVVTEKCERTGSFVNNEPDAKDSDGGDSKFDVFTVHKNSQPSKTGGAIAHRMRERKEVRARAVGVPAVDRLCASVYQAGSYLRARKEDPNMRCQARFVKIEQRMSDTQDYVSAMEIRCFAQ